MKSKTPLTAHQLAEEYQKINQSFRKKCTFFVHTAGVGSMINNILLAMLYCLDNKTFFQIDFSCTIYFKKEGWEDYFLPFCKNLSQPELSERKLEKKSGSIKIFFIKYIYRMIILKFIQIYIEIFSHDLASKMPFYMIEPILFHNSSKSKTFKIIYLYLLLWAKIRSKKFMNKHFYFPQLGINGDIAHAMSVLLKIVYRFNERTQNEVEHIIDKYIDLKTQPYIALHIRRGDKDLLPITREQYVENIKENSNGFHNLFIATDDYREIKKMQILLPEYTIYSTIEPSKLGNKTERFNISSSTERRKELISVFVDWHFLTNAKFFICDYSSNISKMAYLFRNCEEDKMKSLYRSEWMPIYSMDHRLVSKAKKNFKEIF